MARDEINYAALRAAVIEMASVRARAALEAYTREPLKYDSPSYPFRQHDHQSIRDSTSQSIEPTERGIRIVVESVAARFIELGNAPRSGGVIKPKREPRLLLPLRSGGVLALAEVEPYEGTHRLANAVREAFGIPLP